MCVNIIIDYSVGDDMTEEKILQDVNPFIEACDKMVASKFIMIDKRISDVLKSIAKSQPVFELVKECMINFNFDREWKKATSKIGTMLPPDEPHKFVAFVFSMLNCMDDKKISASELLSKYFTKSESNNGPYYEFCEMFIVRFKNVVINKILNKSEDVIVRKQINPVDFDKEVLSRLAFLIKDLKDYIQGMKRLKKSQITKGELLEIVNALYFAVKNNDVRYIKPFLMAIKVGYGKEKEIGFRLLEILDIVDKTFIDS